MAQNSTQGGSLIEFDDLEPVVERFTRAGARFRNEIVSGHGGKQIVAEDLDGNAIELCRPGELVQWAHTGGGFPPPVCQAQTLVLLNM